MRHKNPVFRQSIGVPSKEENLEWQRFLSLYNTGQLGEAKVIIESLLQKNPNNPEFLNFIGIICCQRGEFAEGIIHLEKAIKFRPKEAAYYCNIGNAYQNVGRLDDALKAFEKSLQINPKTFQTYYNLGNIYRDLKEFEKAAEYYKQTLAINPQFLDAHNNLGTTLKELGDLDAALVSYQNGLQLNPNALSILNNVGLIHKDLKKSDEAKKCFERILLLDPQFYEAYLNLASLYKDEEKHEKANELYEKALQLKPNNPIGYINQALNFADQGSLEKALEIINKALMLFPQNGEVYCHLAGIYEQYGKYAEAISANQKAIELDPSSDQAKFNLATLYLLQGDFKNGWKCYDNRLSFQPIKLRTSKFLSILDQPRWQGEDLKGKTLLVVSEQGYGDTIQFCRYLPLLAERGAKVLFRPQDGLETLLSESNLKTEILPPKIVKNFFYFDYHISLLSLPHLFGTEQNTTPFPEGYLKANPIKAEEYRQKYFTTPKFKIGLVWQGATHHLRDHLRSAPLAVFAPLFDLPNVQFYSFQKDTKGEGQIDTFSCKDKLVRLGPTFNDFSDTAAALSNIDLLITVDTSVAHLAGALGKPTWILTAFAVEYRWMLEREDSPWYKSVRLFRQKTPRDWPGVIANIHAELKKQLNPKTDHLAFLKTLKRYIPKIDITFER